MYRRKSPAQPRSRAARRTDVHDRIVAATVALHEELGPAGTTISAIAERAGVERLTVYRHFPDERALLRACSSRWIAAHPLPDPVVWGDIADPAARARAALEAIYTYYRGTRRMLEAVLRDAAVLPVVAESTQGFLGYLQAVSAALAEAWPVAAAQRRTLQSVLHHALNFTTWASLDAEGITDPEKARMVARWVSALSTEPPFLPAPTR